MSLPTKHIDGDIAVGRNAHIGGNSIIRGCVTVGHHLKVDGWLDAPNIKGPLKGLYASEATLNTAYPRPMPGWFALVGNTLPADVYRVEGGKWIPTGEKGGEFSLYLDQLETDVKDLTDEVKDIEELLADGILLAETISFTSTGTEASMTFTVLKRDGTTKQGGKPIPIATTEKAGMMSAADKKSLSDAVTAISEINRKIATLETTTSTLRQELDNEIANRTEADNSLRTLINTESTQRKEADNNLQSLINTLRRDFDTLVGNNASEAIDNFTEVLRFLDGLKDTDKLSTKLADLSGADEKLSADILELQKKVFPLVVTFDVSPTIIKAGQETTVSLSWEARRKERDVTAEADITLDGDPATGKAKSLAIVLSHGQYRQLQLKVEYAGMTVYCASSVKGSLPTYLGVVAKDWVATPANIKSLPDYIVGSRAFTGTNISTNDEKIFLAYPKDFGPLTSIKDGNGYEVLSSYTRGEVNVDTTPYYCYLLTVPVTASGVTQIYK